MYEITEIEKLYLNWYIESSILSYSDQKWIWENVPLPKEENKQRELRTIVNGNENVSGSDNGACKLEVKSELNELKSELISELKHCTSFTPPNEIAHILKEVFKSWTSKNGHWLWVAQSYTARTISWVMEATAKEYLRGGIKKTPPAYFTHLLKFRKKRKQFRSNHDARKC